MQGVEGLSVNLNPMKGGIPADRVQAGDALSQRGFGMDSNGQAAGQELQEAQPAAPQTAGGPAEGTYDW